MTPLITDAELLVLSLASTALNGVAGPTRDMHREVNSDLVRSLLLPRVSGIADAAYVASGEVKNAVAALTAYSILGYRGYNPVAGSDKSVRDRYDEAMKWIERVRTGEAEILNAATDKAGPLVAGTGTSSWDRWRSGGPCE